MSLDGQGEDARRAAPAIFSSRWGTFIWTVFAGLGSRLPLLNGWMAVWMDGCQMNKDWSTTCTLLQKEESFLLFVVVLNNSKGLFANSLLEDNNSSFQSQLTGNLSHSTDALWWWNSQQTAIYLAAVVRYPAAAVCQFSRMSLCVWINWTQPKLARAISQGKYTAFTIGCCCCTVCIWCTASATIPQQSSIAIDYVICMSVYLVRECPKRMQQKNPNDCI